MSVKWCLTPLNAPDKHLHGPYETRKAATTEALKLLSHEAKYSAVINLRHPATLVPTPCDGTRHGVSSYTPPAPPHTQVLAESPAPYTPPLPAAIYRLTESKLRLFAAQLDIKLPPTATTRATIISVLSKEIDL